MSVENEHNIKMKYDAFNNFCSYFNEINVLKHNLDS